MGMTNTKVLEVPVENFTISTMQTFISGFPDYTGAVILCKLPTVAVELFDLEGVPHIRLTYKYEVRSPIRG